MSHLKKIIFIQFLNTNMATIQAFEKALLVVISYVGYLNVLFVLPSTWMGI